MFPKAVIFILPQLETVGRDSDCLRSGRSADQIQVDARFSPPVQTDPEAHSASCKMGTASFTRLKWPGCGFDHPLISSSEVEDRMEL
jgi:hypothetical protein